MKYLNQIILLAGLILLLIGFAVAWLFVNTIHFGTGMVLAFIGIILTLIGIAFMSGGGKD